MLNIENVTNGEIFSEIRKFWELEATGIMDEAKETTFDVKIEKRTDRRITIKCFVIITGYL